MNFRSLKTITLAALTIGLNIGMSAVVVSLTHFAPTKNHPEVILIGDMHHIDKTNEGLHKNLLLKHLDGLAKQNDTVLVLLEASEFSHNRYIKDLPCLTKNPYSYIRILNALPMYADKFKGTTKSGKTAYQNNTVRFYFADERGPGLATFGDFFTVFENPQVLAVLSASLRLNTTNILEIDTYLQRNPRLKKTFFNTIIEPLFNSMKPSINQISAQDCLAEIDKNLSSIKEFRDTFNGTSAEYKIMDSFFRTIKQKWESAQKFFKAHLKKMHEPCINAFINALLTTQSFKTIRYEFIDWILPIVRSVADAGFVTRIIKNQSKFTKIAVVCGNDHAITIKNTLMAGFGYEKPLLESGLQSLEAQPDTVTAIESELLAKHLGAVFKPQESSSTAKQLPSSSASSSSLCTAMAGLSLSSGSSGSSSTSSTASATSDTPKK